MFRRRTDRIYATLQQVQRRITQGTEAGSHGSSRGTVDSGASAEQTSLSHYPRAGSGGAGYMVTPDGRRYETATSRAPEAPSWETHPPTQVTVDTAVERPPAAPPAPVPPPSSGQMPVSHAAERPPAANPALDLAAAEGRRSQISFSKEMATVILGVWISTVVLAYFVGYSTDRSNTEEVSDSLRDTRAQTSPTRTAVGEDIGVYVLMSSPRRTSQVESRYQDEAERLNAILAENDWPARMGVRIPSSGNGIQFVYGLNPDGSFGVERDVHYTQEAIRFLVGQNDGKEGLWVDLD